MTEIERVTRTLGGQSGDSLVFGHLELVRLGHLSMRIDKTYLIVIAYPSLI